MYLISIEIAERVAVCVLSPAELVATIDKHFITEKPSPTQQIMSISSTMQS